MSNSSLVTHTNLSPNKTAPRTSTIKKITIHHMAGNLTVEACGNVFSPSSRQASSNYGVDGKGNVGLYVDEANRSWCSSNSANDHQAVTIEVANDGGEPNWSVSDVALEKTIDLCVDICQRNGIAALNYTGDATGNLTRHDMFKATTCPGPYLGGKFEYIAEQVNARLNGTSEESSSESTEESSGETASTGSSSYTGTSVVDYLKSIGADSSFANRKILATSYGITGYTGTASQNTKLLAYLLADGDDGNEVSSTVAGTSTISYYTKASYTGSSFVDCLKAMGVDSSYTTRKAIATANGISSYTGSATQNTSLLAKAKAGTLIKA